MVQLVAGEITMQEPITVVPRRAVTVYESAGPLDPLRVPPFNRIVALVLPGATVIDGAAGATGTHCEYTVVVSKRIIDAPPA
jgi:hypothetical protein